MRKSKIAIIEITLDDELNIDADVKMKKCFSVDMTRELMSIGRKFNTQVKRMAKKMILNSRKEKFNVQD